MKPMHPSTTALVATGTFLFGFLWAVTLSDRYDDRAAKSGFWYHKAQAYRLVPVER